MTRTPLQGRSGPRAHFRSAPALLGAGSFLLCACPAGAQTLSVGSGTATVSGSGTAVTGGGTTFGGGAGPGTSSYLSGMVGGPAAPATLSLQNGGSIQAITAEKASTINVFGGTVGTIVDVAGVSAILDNINISGGTVTSVSNDRGKLNITGGNIQSVAGDSFAGQITIAGGNVQNVTTPNSLIVNGGTLVSASAPFATITGGTIQTLSISGMNAGGVISGGNISTLNVSSTGATAKISGGSFQFITNNSTFFGHDTINITGTGLQEIGTPTDANNDGVFQLLGLLSDGETLNAQYTQSGASNQLQFNGVAATPTPVPEASTVVSLGGMLLLGGAGAAFRARKRARA